VSFELFDRMHTPVLLSEVLKFLSIEKGDTVLDCTVGAGGHAEAISKFLGPEGKLIGLDQDQRALKETEERLKKSGCLFITRQANFRDLSHVLDALSIEHVNKVLFDLGLSSDQLERSGRGFSFARDEPLLMTFAYPIPKGALTAYELVNSWSEVELADIIHVWGEERRARSIARAIVAARKLRPIGTTRQLVRVIESVVPHLAGERIHPATKTFQALRIAVNDEMGALEDGLRAAFAALESGGRIAVISFHSVEDRTVKQYFAGLARSAEAVLLTKKPVTPSDTEVAANRRARSAKMRALEKA
jgi:16S rRNA (cytosine1402-N4)-methyltransferase